MAGSIRNRWKGYTRRMSVEHCFKLSVAAMIGRERIAVGRAGITRWGDGVGGPLEVTYNFVSDAAGWRADLVLAVPGTGTAWVQRVRLEPAPLPNGGERWYARCPLANADGEACHRRVALLHQPPGVIGFGCRACHRLAYLSSQESDRRVDGLIASGFTDPNKVLKEKIEADPRVAAKAAIKLFIRQVRDDHRAAPKPRRRRK